MERDWCYGQCHARKHCCSISANRANDFAVVKNIGVRHALAAFRQLYDCLTMNSEEIISLYETVAQLSEQMLAAARSADWERLVTLESVCASRVQLLRSGEPVAALSGPLRDTKVRIIHKILADDRAIRNITEPWMVELSALMDSAGAERKLSRAYGANQ